MITALYAMTTTSNRYHRQHQVAQLAGDARAKLSLAHVLIVGVGGLGSPLSLFLAGAGVGEITIIDSDVVSLSNLHRQILFQESDLSKPKVEAAYQQLQNLNSEITLNMVNQKLDASNVAALVAVSYTHLTLPTTPYV